jgi:hypothetical protein
MKWVYGIGGAVLAVWSVFAIFLVTLWWFGLLDGPARTYVVDAKEVVRIFVEEEGKNLTEEEMAAAVRVIDGLVLGEAERIYVETGSIIINKNHMLAGGVDVSSQLASQVIAAWRASR